MEQQTTFRSHYFALTLVCLVSASVGGLIVAFMIFHFYLPRIVADIRQQQQPEVRYVSSVDVSLKQKEANDSVVGGAAIPKDVHNIAGSVVAINGNRITFDVRAVNHSASTILDQRTAVVVADTKIYKVAEKDPKIFQAEIADFRNKNLRAAPDEKTLKPPEPFTRTPVDFSSIAVGDLLVLTALEDIKTKKEFSVSEVLIVPESAFK